MAELNLTAQKIFEKEFGVEFKGYSAAEVDAFLDTVIKDYQSVESVMDDLKNKNALLEQKNATLKSYILELEGKLQSLSDAPAASSTDILKRLSRLEDLVSKQGN